jgi:hypothetical protein
MKYLHHFLIITFLLLLPSLVYAQKPAGLQGTWEMVTQKLNGKTSQIIGRQIKLITARHYSWVRQDKKHTEELLAMHTTSDSIAAYHDEFGAGTYKVTGSTYTETSEFFGEPQYIGRSIEFKFKLKGGLWFISGYYTHFENGKELDKILIEETWKKID